MRPVISRWFMFGLLIGWALTHATVFGQPNARTNEESTGGPAKTATSIDKLRQGLDKQITVNFTGQNIEEVLNHIKDKSGLPISIDDASMAMMNVNFLNPNGQPMQVQVKATNEKTSAVLRKFLNHYRMTYVIFEDSILVTGEEYALMRQMKQRVSVNVEDVPAKKAITDLARNHGINLVIDPKVATQADTAVSLSVDNTGIETAVRLLAELASLKAVRMGNVMFVTDETRAKKIREEEGHQFDNPFNPNMPYVERGIGIGGAFGGVVMPARAVPPLNVPNGVPVPAPAVDLPLQKDPAPLPPNAPPPPDTPVGKKVVPVPPRAPDAPPAPPGVDRPAGQPDLPPLRRQ